MDTFDQLTQLSPYIFVVLGVVVWMRLYVGLVETRPQLHALPFKQVFAPCLLGLMALKLLESGVDSLLPDLTPFYRFPDVLAYTVSDFAAQLRGQPVTYEAYALNYMYFLIIQFTLEALLVLSLTVGIYGVIHRRKAKSSLNPPR